LGEGGIDREKISQQVSEALVGEDREGGENPCARPEVREGIRPTDAACGGRTYRAVPGILARARAAASRGELLRIPIEPQKRRLGGMPDHQGWQGLPGRN